MKVNTLLLLGLLISTGKAQTGALQIYAYMSTTINQAVNEHITYSRTIPKTCGTYDSATLTMNWKATPQDSFSNPYALLCDTSVYVNFYINIVRLAQKYLDSNQAYIQRVVDSGKTIDKDNIVFRYGSNVKSFGTLIQSTIGDKFIMVLEGGGRYAHFRYYESAGFLCTQTKNAQSALSPIFQAAIANINQIPTTSIKRKAKRLNTPTVKAFDPLGRTYRGAFPLFASSSPL